MDQRSVFDNKQITCIEYDALSDKQQRDIFQRVQNGVALTAAGKLYYVSRLFNCSICSRASAGDVRASS